MVNRMQNEGIVKADLWQLIFVNGGVKLTTASSPVPEDLQEYEKSGVIVLDCRTCLELFDLKTEKKVGSNTKSTNHCNPVR